MNIVIYNNRFSKAPDNQKEITNNEFVQLLNAPKKSDYTLEEFKQLDKDEQVKVKDNGAFVIGEVTGRDVSKRTHLVLDCEGSDMNISETFDFVFPDDEINFITYTTIKNTPKLPRHRLIIELDRPVSTNEYEELAARFMQIVNNNLGVEMFDKSCAEMNRLMFLPVQLKNSQYEVVQREGNLLNVDEILNDTSIVVEKKSIGYDKENLTKFERKDPRMSEDLPGAYCTIYSMTYVLENVLNNIYAKTNQPNRYHFIGSDSPPGVNVYNDLFVYSQHNSDPACQKLLDAWHIVQLHKFNNSFSSMAEAVKQDEAVMSEYNKKMQIEESGDTTTTWTKKLIKNKQGMLLNLFNNYVLILENDPELKEAFKYNSLSKAQEIDHQLSWHQRDKTDTTWTSIDDANAMVHIEKHYGKCDRASCITALKARLSHVEYNPLLDYLDTLPEWDKKERAESIFIDYLGAIDTPINRSITRKFLTACMARAYTPGIKWELVPILCGSQGIGKSTICRILANDKFFGDGMPSLDNDKESAMYIQGKWIVELSELTALISDKYKAEDTKAFISRQSDRFRVPYETSHMDVKRTTIFIGTTNEDEFLSDTSGNRRFLPIRCMGDKTVDYMIKHMEPLQIWAEVKERFYDVKNKINIEPLYFTKAEEETQNKIIKEYTETYSYIPKVLKWLDYKVPSNWETLTKRDRINTIFMWYEDPETNGRNKEFLVERKTISLQEIAEECLMRNDSELKRQDKKIITAALRESGDWDMNPFADNDIRYGPIKKYRRRIK